MTDPPETPWNDSPASGHDHGVSAGQRRSDSTDQIVTPQPVLAALLRVITAFNAKVRVTCASGRVHVHGTDESRVGWVDVTVQSEAIRGDLGATQTRFGLDQHRLQSVLKGYGSQSSVTVSVNRATQNVTAVVDALTYTSSLFQLGTIPRVAAPRHVTRPVVVHCPGEVLTDAVWIADKLGETLTIAWDATAKEAYMTATGDTDAFKQTFPLEDGTALPGTDMHTTVDVDKLKRIENGIRADQRVRVSFGEDTSLRLSFSFADGAAHAVFTLRKVVSHASGNRAWP